MTRCWKNFCSMVRKSQKGQGVLALMVRRTLPLNWSTTKRLKTSLQETPIVFSTVILAPYARSSCKSVLDVLFATKLMTLLPLIASVGCTLRGAAHGTG